MTCAVCAGRVERGLRKVDGVDAASVNYASGMATISLAREIPDSDIAAAVRSIGYDVAPKRPEAVRTGLPDWAPFAATLAVFVLAMILSAPLSGSHQSGDLLHRIAMPWTDSLKRHFPSFWRIHPDTLRFALFLLHLPVVLWLARPIFARGAKALLDRSPDMNSLVALGAGAAFGLSLLATFHPSWFAARGLAAQVYYESVSGVLGFVLFGKWLEERSRRKAKDALGTLASLLPAKAWLVRDGECLEVDSDLLVPGDRIRVLPHERVPADGTIRMGTGAFDESHLTGESLPRERGVGDPLQAGAVNGSTPIELEVERSGEATQVARVLALVEEAQATKAPDEHLADRISRVFVPSVMALALLAGLLWWIAGPNPAGPRALVVAISVLVVACPCALGLAVPSAIMVATGRAARHGILLRDARTLDAIARCDTVVFDKTGTLTEGKPRLVRWTVTEGLTIDQILTIAASLEEGSSHPLARPIVEAAKSRGCAWKALPEATTLPGKGVEAKTEKTRIKVGAPDWLGTGDPSQPGESAVGIEVNGNILGFLFLSDPPRPEAVATIQALQRRGLRTELLSGDGQSAVAHVAQILGIPSWRARATPEGKGERIRDLQRQGRKVLMVGDGVNDAIALSQADASLAIASGTAVAFDCAMGAIGPDDPRLAVDAIDLGARTRSTIRQNLAWAFGYNAILIPVAAGVLWPFGGPLLSPALAGAAMSISSVTVMLNSLRLLGWRPRAGR